MLRQSARSARATRGVPAFTPGRADELARLTQAEFTAASNPKTGELDTVGTFTVSASSRLKLQLGKPTRLYVNCAEQFTFTAAATQVLALSAAPIATTRPQPALPSAALKDIRVIVTAGPDHIGTYLPVTVFADGTKNVTIDTSALTAGSSYTVEARYLPEGGTIQVQLQAPVGTDGRTTALLTDGTREAFTRNPVSNKGYLVLPVVAHQPELALPRYWGVNLRADYPVTPTLDDSDVNLPARIEFGAWHDAASATAALLAQLGM